MSVATPKPAATIIVARSVDEGVEVLMLRRGPGVTFGPGFVAFPGGSIDPEDEQLGLEWFGERDQAALAAGVRELAEETRIAITASGLRVLDENEDPVLAISSDPPRREDLPQIARWIAPEFLEVRFDARFFAAAAPPEIDPIADGLENDLAWWARPSEILETHQLGTTLMWPTFHMLRALADCSTVSDVLSLQVEQVAPPMPRPS